MSDSINNTMVTSKHNLIPNTASNRSPTPSSSGRSVYEFIEFFKTFVPTLSYTSVVYMLIVVVILSLALAFVIKPRWNRWKLSFQQLSEKVRLRITGPMVGDFRKETPKNIWTAPRQDTVVITNRDEKSRRLSPDMSSSSSTSLSPSVLPTHNTSPGLYKKTPNSRSSHRRPSSRQKTQPQNIPASSLSPIEDNPSSTSSSIDSHIEQSSTFTEQDETKTSVTIHVADTLTRTVPSTCQEDKGEVDKIGNSLNTNSDDKIAHTNEKLEMDQDFIQDKNISPWAESQTTPTIISNRDDKSRRPIADTFSESSISSTNNGSPKLQKKISNSPVKNRKQNSRKEQTIVSATQESDGEIDSVISDDHSEHSLIQQNDTTVPIVQKRVQGSTQEETVKSGHRRRRRRTRGSKNNQQRTQQNQQTQNSDQRSLKQEQQISSQKQDISSEVSKSRHYHSNEIPKSRQTVEKLKVANYDVWERHPHQHAESHQSSRSDQTYFLQANKRNGQICHSATPNGTAIPAKATLSESNRKAAVFSRTDIHWKPNVIASSSHVSALPNNFNPVSPSNVPISRFATYADVIAPHNRPSAITTGPPRSRLSDENNIATPVPVASMDNTTNYQWYSPFGSGLSIQLTPPASPQNIHRQLPHNNSNAQNPIFSSMYSSKQSQDRNRNVIAPPSPISAPNNASSFSSSPSSSLSMFASSPFSSLSNSLSGQNQSNVITSPTNSSFRESLFGRKHPVQDQEKGELSDDADDSESWNKMMGISDLTNQRTWIGQNENRKGKFSEETRNESISENVWHREQHSQQQFSLFDKRLSFMYPPKS